MLTGDKKVIGEKVAEELEIDTFLSELLPNEKVKFIENLSKTSKNKIAFCGDGIINYTIEKEFSVEVVGDAKIKVGINIDEDEQEEQKTIEDEIEENVNEDFLG